MSLLVPHNRAECIIFQLISTDRPSVPEGIRLRRMDIAINGMPRHTPSILLLPVRVEDIATKYASSIINCFEHREAYSEKRDTICNYLNHNNCNLYIYCDNANFLN